MKDFGLNKGLENLGCLRQKLVAITDRFAGFAAQSLNVHVDLPLFQRMARPVMAGKAEIAGIQIHDTRMMRLMEVLLHGGTQLNGWRSADMPPAVLTTLGLSASTYTLTQLRYDLRKGKPTACSNASDEPTAFASPHPVPQARLRAAGQLAVPSEAARNPQARQQGRDYLSQGRS